MQIHRQLVHNCSACFQWKKQQFGFNMSHCALQQWIHHRSNSGLPIRLTQLDSRIGLESELTYLRLDSTKDLPWNLKAKIFKPWSGKIPELKTAAGTPCMATCGLSVTLPHWKDLVSANKHCWCSFERKMFKWRVILVVNRFGFALKDLMWEFLMSSDVLWQAGA